MKLIQIPSNICSTKETAKMMIDIIRMVCEIMPIMNSMTASKTVTKDAANMAGLAEYILSRMNTTNQIMSRIRTPNVLFVSWFVAWNRPSISVEFVTLTKLYGCGIFLAPLHSKYKICDSYD